MGWKLGSLFNPSSLVTSGGALTSMVTGDPILGVASQLGGAGLYENEKAAEQNRQNDAATAARQAAQDRLNGLTNNGQSNENPFAAGGEGLPANYTTPDGRTFINPSAAAADPRGTLSAVTRAQWTDFEKNAIPVQRQLEGMTTYDGNKGVVGDLKTQGMAAVNSAYGGLTDSVSRQNARFGMAANPSESATLDRSVNLGKAAGMVDVNNRANQTQTDLNRQIVSGASLSGGRNYTG